MLSYALAIAVAISSFVLFLTAFFMSDIHRKDDFLWSAVGLFYALVLWFCARNITGAVLLGQASASLLLVSFVWQTLKLRKAVANPERAVAINNFSVLRAVNNLLDRQKKQPQVTPTPFDGADVVTESEIAIPQTASTEVKSPPSDRQVNQKANKPNVFGKIFGKKKKAAITDTKPDTVPKEEETVKTKATTPQKKQVSVAPPTDIKSEKSERDTVAESIEEKQKETVDITQQEPVNKEDAVTNPPKIVEPEKPTSTEETKAVDKEIVENQTSDTSNIESSTQIEPKVSTSIEQPKASRNIVKNDSEQETKIVKTETNLESEVVSAKKIEEVEVSKPKTDANNSEQETEIIKTETNLESEVVSTKTVEEVEVIKPKTNKSDLDSLETVEVAEVLEALPENSSQERNSDRSNIIEVTTSDIEEVKEADLETEAKQPEDSQSD